MNNPNPFVPKGSLLEQQSQRRSRLKLAVFCVLAVSVTGLVAMLIQGCKRENPDQTNNLVVETNPPPLQMASTDTNPPVPMPPPATSSNMMVMPPPPPPPVEPAAGSEYVVVKGDMLTTIAKAHGVSLKALEAANPGVDPKKLHIKQKLIIPPVTKATEATLAMPPSTGDNGEVYVVKSGDTLGKIAKAHGTTVKAIQAANSLSTTKIKVGDKLKLPASTAATPAVDTTAPSAVPMPLPPPSPTTNPVR